MLSTQLQGGLGNQMFQIAAAYGVALRNNVIPQFNFENHYLPLQGRKAKNYIDSVFRNIKINNALHSFENTYREESHHFSEIEYKEDLYLIGYFQSERYFSDCKEEIRELFAPSDEISSYLQDKYDDILNKISTSIHIRRGDYLKFSNIHPQCTQEYYIKAISLVAPTEVYVVFSDDPEWCKSNFAGSKFYVVDNEEDYIDMYLMSKCNNNIIANSSFSWWGAWLNTNQSKKVITPSRWFGNDGPQDTQDIIPDDWIKVDV
tara:strand:+ start:8542 stop:9324 length:783 start_codon:yes stop_codon:yes gene_type:complete